MYNKFGIKEEILNLSKRVEKELKPIFENVQKIFPFSSFEN